MIEKLITTEIEALIDPEQWLLTTEDEEAVKARLRKVYKYWDEIESMLELLD